MSTSVDCVVLSDGTGTVLGRNCPHLLIVLSNGTGTVLRRNCPHLLIVLSNGTGTVLGRNCPHLLIVLCLMGQVLCSEEIVLIC